MNRFNLIASVNSVQGTGGAPPPEPEPPNIIDILGANLRLYVDTEDAAKVSLTGVNANELVSITSSDASAVSLVSLTSQRTIWQGHSLYTRGATFLSISASTAYYNFLHDSTPSVIAFRIFPERDAVTSVIFNNNNNQSTQKGIRVLWQSNNVGIQISKGTSGQVPISGAWGPGNCTPGAWHDVLIKDTGTVVTVYIDGVAGTPVTNAYARGTGAAGFNMYMFRYASSGSLWGADICVKRPMFIDRMTTTEEDLLIRELLEGDLDFGDVVGSLGGLARVHSCNGQSNESGRANDFGGAPAYYDDPTGAMMWNKTNNTPDRLVNYWAPHQLGVNCSTEGQTEAGPDIEFAYRMSLLAPGEIYLVKYATTGSSMKPAAFPDKDWTYTSGTDDNCYRAFDQALVYALKQLKYELNKNVSIEGFNWRQGESDTTAPNDYYYDYMRAMLVDRFKAAAELHGFSVANCRICISSLDHFVPVRGAGCQNIVDQCDEIVADAVEMGFAGGQQNSSVGYGLQGDGTHLNTAGQISLGFDRYNYHKDFL
jgi:hypothetical protein